MEHASATDSDTSRVSWYVLAIGVVLVLVLTAETLLRVLGFVTVRQTTLVLSGEYLIGVVSSIPFIAAIFWGGLKLRRARYASVDHSRVLLWVLSSVVVSLCINGSLILLTEDLSIWYVIGWLRWGIALGGGVGMLVGYIEMRAVLNALDAERARLQAEQIETQRETLDYLNSLLRHEVLNGMNVIEGHSLLLEQKLDDEELEETHVRPIVRHSQDISAVISDVRRLVGVIQGDQELEPVDLRRALEEEVRKLRDTHPDADISLDVPSDVFVYGNEMLPRVFGNLLANAVEHNDNESPRVRVESHIGEDEVEVLVSDDGPGIDDTARETLFERPDAGPTDHGFGLYLVSQLCEHYDGDIDLVETGPEGTTFGVPLQRAPEPPSMASAEPFSAESPT
ncbi:sensor histidine kinase [Haloglomus halophilum]|uniref:sensor histidine kinase n=1 Tax=Haloglomus halophilum TaxID=2962672 RepID=UPI0020CA0882|nr:HAMP domain-containing sensor histidine kinase [Haloglomus halophilum]